ncbi:MAG: hypothetical protein ACI8XO_001813 [Verrucomicrobiales bacterium]|jgi:hypothetical protein
MGIRATIAFGLLLFTMAISAADPDDAACERLVEFRDGSILRLNLTADYQFEFRETILGISGETSAAKLRLDYPTAIRFSKLPALKQLRSIQEAIGQLNADGFGQREQALRTLVGGGAGFRPFIEDIFREVLIPETRSRLATALEAIPVSAGIHHLSYDEIVVGSETTKGDIGEWQTASTYRGVAVQLNRAKVRAIRKAPPLGKRGNTPIIATTEPIRKDLDLLFPPDCERIDFETDSKGDPLRAGQDISRRFIRDGLLISTSIDGSFFSVNDFTVSGRSGEQSGATHDPLYKGIVTLTFCVPGNEHELAGVTHVGLYTAIVQEGGTTLVAFDASGHRIASVTTESGPHEFLGLRSNVPIHQVQIIPNIDIDEDVTIDDIVFSVPETLDAGGAERAHSLDFVTGERLICDDFELEGDRVMATPIGAFCGQIAFPRNELVQLRTPAENHALEPDEAAIDLVRFWILLQDGSTMLARPGEPGASPHTLLEKLELAALPIGAIWQEGGELAPFPADTKLEPDQIASIATTTPMLLTAPAFQSDMLTAVDGDATVEFLYNRMPTIWLKAPDPEARKRASGFVRLNTGERLVLGTATTFKLKSFDSKTITLTKGDDTITLPMETVTTLRLPKSE